MKLLALKGKKQKTIIEKEPYVSFLKQFEKMNGNFDEPINIKISSQNTNKSFFSNGFNLDYVYCTQFSLDFMFGTIIEENSKKTKSVIYHVISYKFDPSFGKMMSDLVEDINSRNGYLYISSLSQEIQIEAYINNINTVSIAYNIYCQKNDIKELCLELISHDIALFTRGF